MLVLTTGCVAKTGWERSEQRLCESEGPARVCFQADPDGPLVLEVGGVRIVPGECAEAPQNPGKRDRGGRIALTVVDGRTHTQQTRKVWVRPGRELVVMQGAKRPQVATRKRCTGLP